MNRPVRWSRDALTDFADHVAFNASDSSLVARRVADAIDSAAATLGDMPIGRPGRLAAKYEESVKGLPYLLAYAIAQTRGDEAFVIVRVIHT